LRRTGGKETLESLNGFLSEPERVDLPNGTTVEIAKYFIIFKPWKGKEAINTYGGKAVIDFQAEPVFAELAILRYLQKDGWDGVWVDNYRRKFRVGLPEKTEPVSLPSEINVLFENIISINGSRSGCWDIIAWRDARIFFVEAKRKKRDRMRSTQYQWLQSALSAGIRLHSFRLVEWELNSNLDSGI
jgi:hypothetical protein